MTELTELALPTEVLRALGLPERTYPVRAAVLAAIDTTAPPLAEMLFGLQCASAGDERGWPQLEPAMARLAKLLARHTHKGFTQELSGPNWWLRLGGVDLKTTIVTVQRGNELIAALQPTRDGRLCVCTYRPLDAKSADYLTALGQTPHPETGVCMRADNWAFALDCSVGMGNHYADALGEAYLSYWEHGIGILWDRSEEPRFRRCLDLTPRPAAELAAELTTYAHCMAAESE